jgi:hypothetical protein
LEGKNSGPLESKVSLEILGDLTNKSLEGSLSDQELSGLLVSSNLAKSDSTRAVSVGLLDTTSSGGGLAGSLGLKFLTGGLSTGRLAGSLLGTSTVKLLTITLTVSSTILLTILILTIKKSSSKSIKSASLSLEGMDDIKSSDSLSPGVFSVGDSITDNVLKEDLEYSSGLLVDQSRETLDSSSSRQSFDGRLGDS